jgi:uncharacterized protein YifE (UPF0438 family)
VLEPVVLELVVLEPVQQEELARVQACLLERAAQLLENRWPEHFLPRLEKLKRFHSSTTPTSQRNTLHQVHRKTKKLYLSIDIS